MTPRRIMAPRQKMVRAEKRPAREIIKLMLGTRLYTVITILLLLYCSALFIRYVSEKIKDKVPDKYLYRSVGREKQTRA